MSYRQEIGKARATAVLGLRAEVVELRAHLSYHWHRYTASRSYPGDFLLPSARSRYLCDMVAHAWGLSSRPRKRVRRQLVEIFGELNVRAAEELSMVPMKDERFHAANDTEVWQAALLAGFEEAEALGLEMTGSLDDFARDQASEDKYNRLQSDLSDLLLGLGGAAHLAS
ncbi:hypothetical protein [Streptomyces sp. WMMC940]|uniref:hypothetical protein n=1 Tax=Streptomyces sp. WMMC940 TaxID=3015153 RepID=UPI0022B6CC6A|nr:hypothetical protein [Streptomyces sp. WMMC940]MCZ7458914.1 hypothetical protein [Streptomyces sp. WMMC940]